MILLKKSVIFLPNSVLLGKTHMDQEAFILLPNHRMQKRAKLAKQLKMKCFV